MFELAVKYVTSCAKKYIPFSQKRQLYDAQEEVAKKTSEISQKESELKTKIRDYETMERRIQTGAYGRKDISLGMAVCLFGHHSTRQFVQPFIRPMMRYATKFSHFPKCVCSFPVALFISLEFGNFLCLIQYHF